MNININTIEEQFINVYPRMCLPIFDAQDQIWRVIRASVVPKDAISTPASLEPWGLVINENAALTDGLQVAFDPVALSAVCCFLPTGANDYRIGFGWIKTVVFDDSRMAVPMLQIDAATRYRLFDTQATTAIDLETEMQGDHLLANVTATITGTHTYGHVADGWVSDPRLHDDIAAPSEMNVEHRFAPLLIPSWIEPRSSWKCVMMLSSNNNCLNNQSNLTVSKGLQPGKTYPFETFMAISAPLLGIDTHHVISGGMHADAPNMQLYPKDHEWITTERRVTDCPEKPGFTFSTEEQIDLGAVVPVNEDALYQIVNPQRHAKGVGRLFDLVSKVSGSQHIRASRTSSGSERKSGELS